MHLAPLNEPAATSRFRNACCSKRERSARSTRCRKIRDSSFNLSARDGGGLSSPRRSTRVAFHDFFLPPYTTGQRHHALCLIFIIPGRRFRFLCRPQETQRTPRSGPPDRPRADNAHCIGSTPHSNGRSFSVFVFRTPARCISREQSLNICIGVSRRALHLTSI